METVALNPDKLREVIKAILGKKKDGNIFMEAKDGVFSVTDGYCKSHEIPCAGSWTEAAAVSGKLIKSIADMLAGQEAVILSLDDALLVVKGRSTTSRIPRTNASGLNVYIPVRRRKTEKKKPSYQPYINPEPTTKKAEYGDTWGFSARVPLPAEAYKDRPKGDWEKE